MRTWSLIILGIISIITAAAAAVLSNVSVESGSQVISFMDVMHVPYEFVAILWPVLVISANCRSRQVRVIAKALTLSYYAWLALASWKMFYDLFWELSWDLLIDRRGLRSTRGMTLLLSSVLFSGLQALIWVPSFFFVKNEDGRSPWLVLDSRKKHTLILIGLGIVSVGLTLSALLLTAFMGGVGNLNFPLLDIVLGPFQVFIFAWPILVVCANWPSRRVRLAAKWVTLGYYAWLLSFGWYASSNFLFHFKSICQEFGWFVPYVVLLFASLQVLIWLPSFFLVKKSKDQAPVEVNPTIA